MNEHLNETIKFLLQQFESKLKYFFEEVLDIDQLETFLRLDKQTIYNLTSKRLIPFSKPTGKLLFLKSEIIDWLKRNHVDTLEEIEMKVKTNQLK